MNLWLIFLTGLSTGGLTCLALQGGLLTMAITARSSDTGWKTAILPTAVFLGFKLISYTLLGFFLGWFGSVFTLSPLTQMLMQYAVGIFMIITALRMWDIHPIFRRFALTPPKFIFKNLRQNARSGSLFSPAILGLSTIFLPCGTTQAVEITAVGTGNPLLASLTMFVFTVGTIPLFFILGTLASGFKSQFDKYIQPVAAVLILVLGILAIDNGLTLSGSPFTLKKFWQVSTGPVQTDISQSSPQGQAQLLRITVNDTGYEPNRMRIKANLPTYVTFITDNTRGCSRAITFPTLNIQKILPLSGETTVTLPPLAHGTIPFSCSMGMYTGEIEVM